LLSEYFWREKKKYLLPDDFDPEQFDVWCEVMMSDLNDSHKEPQVNFVDNTLDFIGRFERLESDFKHLLRILSKKSTTYFSRYQNRLFPFENDTGLSKTEIIPHIMEKTKQKILKIYHQDFEKFNYEC
jgi:hypothetical protein